MFDYQVNIDSTKYVLSSSQEGRDETIKVVIRVPKPEDMYNQHGLLTNTKGHEPRQVINNIEFLPGSLVNF